MFVVLIRNADNVEQYFLDHTLHVPPVVPLFMRKYVKQLKMAAMLRRRDARNVMPLFPQMYFRVLNAVVTVLFNESKNYDIY